MENRVRLKANLEKFFMKSLKSEVEHLKSKQAYIEEQKRKQRRAKKKKVPEGEEERKEEIVIDKDFDFDAERKKSE